MSQRCRHDWRDSDVRLKVIEHYRQPWVHDFEGGEAVWSGASDDFYMIEHVDVKCICGRIWSGSRYSRRMPKWVRSALDEVDRLVAEGL